MQTVSLPPLLNREFKLPDDGVFQFAPLGEYPIIDPVTKNRVVQVVDAESVRAMAADVAALKAKPNWPGLLVDRDHFSFDTEKESRAAGWVNDAIDRGAEGLFGPIRWTNSGEGDVKGGEYRFLSPVFDRKSAVPLGGGRFRVMKLLGLALTNTPNIRNIQALTNRAEIFHGREAITETQSKGNAMKDRLIPLLKMDANSTEDQVVAAVTAFMNRASELDALKGTHATLKSEHDALKNRHTALLTVSVDGALKEFAGIIAPTAVEAWKNRLTADFDGTVVLLRGLKPAAAADDAKIEAALKEHAGVITAESRDTWKNRLASDFDGTVALLKGIKKPDKKKPVHGDGKGGKGAVGTTGDDEPHPFMNRVTEVMVERKLDKADAIAAVASAEPTLYADYRESLTGGE